MEAMKTEYIMEYVDECIDELVDILYHWLAIDEANIVYLLKHSGSP